MDYELEGFKWLDCHQEEKCIYAFERYCEGQKIVAIFNFSAEKYDNYEVEIDREGNIEVLFDSNMEQYGGDGNCSYRTLIEENTKYVEREDRNDHSLIIANSVKRLLSVDIKPFSAIYYVFK